MMKKAKCTFGHLFTHCSGTDSDGEVVIMKDDLLWDGESILEKLRG